jgi:hypothetical protein
MVYFDPMAYKAVGFCFARPEAGQNNPPKLCGGWIRGRRPGKTTRRSFVAGGSEAGGRAKQPAKGGRLKEINVTPRVSILTIYVCDQPSQSSGGPRYK